MRPPVDHIAAPEFPARLQWINSSRLRMDMERGRPVLIEFWDFCRPNSIRTLPYLKAWHERYEPDGLRVIGIHASGFEPSKEPESVREAVARLAIPYPVAIDMEYELWQLYGNFGWPSRYLFDQHGLLSHYHYGEGGYGDTERAVQELLGVERPVLEPLKPEDDPGARLAPQTEDVEGDYSGPYVAGAVWAVLDGHGVISANGRVTTVDHPGCYPLIEHARSTASDLQLEIGPGVRCHAVCFTPGLAD